MPINGFPPQPPDSSALTAHTHGPRPGPAPRVARLQRRPAAGKPRNAIAPSSPRGKGSGAAARHRAGRGTPPDRRGRREAGPARPHAALRRGPGGRACPAGQWEAAPSFRPSFPPAASSQAGAVRGQPCGEPRPCAVTWARAAGELLRGRAGGAGGR